MAKKTKALKLKKVFVLIAIAVICLPLLFYLYFLDRFYPNVYIGGVNLGGKSQLEAISLVHPNLNFPDTLTLKYNNKSYNLSVSSLGIIADYDKTIKRAMLMGRSGNILFDINQILTNFTKNYDFPLELTFNEDNLTNFMGSVAKEIDIAPQDAKFTIQDNKVQSFLPENNGLKVDKDKLKNKIVDAIKSNSVNNFIIDIPTQIDLPKIKTSDVNSLGITEQIGSGTSHFAGSIGTRIYNINLASSRINNSLIAPGQIFSFDDMVGDISALNGYKQAYVIENGKTILGDGGGVCQVSTTMFRAAMNSGLPIVERQLSSATPTLTVFIIMK